MWGAGCCPAGSVVLACAVVPAVVLAGGGVLAGWCPLLEGAVFGKEKERERMNNKTTIPTQNIIYPPLEGGIYNIAKFLQK